MTRQLSSGPLHASERITTLKDNRTLHGDDLIYYICFIAWIVVSIISLTSFFGSWITIQHWRVLSGLCVGALAVSELLAWKRGIRWTRKSVVGFLICCLMTFCSYRAGVVDVMVSIPFIFCARNRNLKVLFTLSIVAMGLTMACVMLAAYHGLILNYISEEGRMRHYLGFRYPLRPAMIMFAITGMTLLVKREPLKLHDAVMLLVANTSLFCLTGSRLSFALATLGIIVACGLSRIPLATRGAKTTAFICAAFLVAIAASSVGVSALYNPDVEWMSQLNMQLGGRLKLGHDGLAQFGITPFGQYVRLIGNGLDLNGNKSSEPYNYIDNLYLQLLIKYGVFFFIVYLVTMAVSCYRNVRRGNWIAAMILILIAIHGTTDNLSLCLCLNPTLLLLSEVMREPSALMDGNP